MWAFHRSSSSDSPTSSLYYMDDQRYIEKLKQENEKLSRRNYALTREVNELKGSLSESEARVSELLTENDELQAKIDALKIKLTPSPILKTNPSIREFLSPKINGWGESLEESGLEVDWDYVMMAFTDKIFVDADQPDLPLYYDEGRRGFCSFQGTAFLKFPITSKKLEEIGVIKVRKPTEMELKTLQRNFKI